MNCRNNYCIQDVCQEHHCKLWVKQSILEKVNSGILSEPSCCFLKQERAVLVQSIDKIIMKARIECN